MPISRWFTDWKYSFTRIQWVMASWVLPNFQQNWSQWHMFGGLAWFSPLVCSWNPIFVDLCWSLGSEPRINSIMIFSTTYSKYTLGHYIPHIWICLDMFGWFTIIPCLSLNIERIWYQHQPVVNIYVTIGYISILSPSTKKTFLAYWNQHQNMRAAKDRYPPSLYWYHQCAFPWISQQRWIYRENLHGHVRSICSLNLSHKPWGLIRIDMVGLW